MIKEKRVKEVKFLFGHLFRLLPLVRLLFLANNAFYRSFTRSLCKIACLQQKQPHKAAGFRRGGNRCFGFWFLTVELNVYYSYNYADRKLIKYFTLSIIN